jgi:CSLREA domain-containing protein
MQSTPCLVYGTFAIFLIAIVTPSLCTSDDIYVTTTADTNDGICEPPFPCSLRDALISANARPGVDFVHLPPGVFNLTIPGVGEDGGLTGDLDISETVYLYGSGPEETIVDGQGLDRVFHLHHSTGWVSLAKMTIRGGDSSLSPGNQHGAGIASHGGGLTWIGACIVEDNETDNGHAGGVHQRDGELRIYKSVFRGNHAEGGSAVAAYIATVDIDFSTFVDNYASDFSLTGTGGAIWLADSTSDLSNSTITNNRSRLVGQNAGVFVRGGSARLNHCTLVLNDESDVYNDPWDPGTLYFRNSIILGSCNVATATTENGNVEGPGGTCGLSVFDITHATIQLHPLGSYGGSTPTMPPVASPGNPVIDLTWADYLCGSEDQREISRPQDGDGNGTAICDSGAVEYRGLLFGDGFETGTAIRWTQTNFKTKSSIRSAPASPDRCHGSHHHNSGTCKAVR